MRGKSDAFLILGAVMIAMTTVFAAPHHPLEDLVLRGNWEEIRSQTSAESDDPIIRFLNAVSEDFVRKRDLVGVLNTVGEDTAAIAQVYRWIEQLFFQNPDNAQALYLGGTMAILSGNPEATVSILTDVLVIDPSCQPAYATRGVAYYMMGNFPFSLADYAIALELDPSDFSSYGNRANTRMAMEDYLGAIEDMDRAILLMPSSSSLHFNRGNANFALFNDSLAIADYTRAIELDSNNIDANFNRARSYLKRNETDLALADYRMFLKKCPMEKVDLRRQARKMIRTSLDSKYRNTESGSVTWEALMEARAHTSNREYREAIEAASRAIALDSHYFESYVLISQAYCNLGEPDSAYTYADVSIRQDSTAEWGWLMRGFSLIYTTKGALVFDDTLSSVQAKVERSYAAQPDFSRAIELNPDFASPYYYRALTYRTLGDTSAAVKDLELFLQLADKIHRNLIPGAQRVLRELRPE